MAYSRMDTEEEIHTGNPARMLPGSSDDLAQALPYRRHADRLDSPRIILAPPPSVATPDDVSSSEADALRDICQIRQSLRQLSAPWVVPPPDAESFVITAGLAIPAADGAFHAVCSVSVPDGRNGVLTELANVFVGGGFTDYQGGLIQWRLERNPGTGIAAAERNYDNIVASLGSATNPHKLPGGIRVNEDDVMQLSVKNIAIVPAGQFIGGLLGGWFYPRTWDMEFQRRSAQTDTAW